MDPRISFEHARNFTISGGNFGDVEGDVMTVNTNDVHSLPHLVRRLDLGSRHPRRLTRESSGQQRTPSFRPVAPSPAPSESSTDLPTSTNDHREVPGHPVVPPTNALGLDGVPPPQNPFQQTRRSHGEANARPHYPQMRSGTDSRTSTFSPPDRPRPSPLRPRDPTHVMATGESHGLSNSYTQPSPASADTTRRQRAFQPVPLPLGGVDSTTHTQSAIPHRHAPPPTEYYPTVMTPALPQEPASRQRATLHTQSPSLGRPIPAMTSTTSVLPPHMHAPRPMHAPCPMFTPSAVQQASHFSPRSNGMQGVRGSPRVSDSFGESSASFNAAHYPQIPGSYYVDHDQRGHRVIHPHGQHYPAVHVLSPTVAPPFQGHEHIAPPPMSGGAPQPQAPPHYYDGTCWGWYGQSPYPTESRQPRYMAPVTPREVWRGPERF